MAHCRVDRIARFIGNGQQRQANFLAAHAKPREAIFGPRQPWLQKDRGMQRHQLVLISQCTRVVAGQRRFLKLGAKTRRDICRYRNAAHAAMRVEAQRRRILTRKLNEISPTGFALH